MMNEGQELAVPAGDEEQRTNYVRIPKGFFIAGLVAMTALVGSAFGLAVSNRAAIQGQTSFSSNQQALNPADQMKNFPDMSLAALGDLSLGQIEEQLEELVSNGESLSEGEKAEVENLLGSSLWYLYFKGRSLFLVSLSSLSSRTHIR